MSKKTILFALLSCLAFTNVRAFTLYGTITDGTDPIAYATAYIKGTSYGVVSNIKGQYRMNLDAGTYIVTFSSLGFQEFSQQISVSGDVELNVKLSSSTEMLTAVEVDKNREDPAYRIIREAIKRRKSLNLNLETWKSDMYIKASLEVENLNRPDTSTPDLTTRTSINLIESISEVYYKEGDGFKEIIKAYRDLASQKAQTSSVTIQLGGESPVQNVKVVNPYLYFTGINDGDINFNSELLNVPVLSSIPFVSPIADNAIRLYSYRLLGSFTEDSVLIYKIRVTPKTLKNSVSGIIYINDKDFTIKAVDLELQEGDLLFFDHFHILQDYKEVAPNYCMPVREEFNYDAAIEHHKTTFGNTQVYFSNYQINLPVTSKFMRQGSVVYDKESMKRGEDYWDNLRPVSLKSIERKFIRVQDSIFAYHHSVEYLDMQDSIINDLKFWDFIIYGITHSNHKKGNSWYLDPLIQQIQINNVDGYRHKLGGSYTKTWKNETDLYLHGNVSYGAVNENVRGQGGFRYMFDPFHFTRVSFQYTHEYTMINTNNSIRGTLSPSNYSDNVGYSFGYGRELFNGFLLTSNVQYNLFRPYKGKTLEALWDNFPLFANPKDFKPFEELVLDLTARITFRQHYEIKPDRKVILGTRYPVVFIYYSKGIKPFLKSDVNFDKLEIRSDYDKRIARMGISRFSFRLGRYLNNREVRLSNLRYFRGSDRYYFSNALSTFQLIGDTSLRTAKTYLQVHYAHHFNGAILGRIKMFNYISLQSAVGASALYLEETGLKHFETFVGLEKPFRLWGQIFRVGVYYTAGVDNINGFTQAIKIGFDSYNSSTRSWQY
ncbi:MAG: hypothetical protein GC181_03330 [Bacteroidetes bacterium]|nr:hypothetical protein [Bacteroidota bacterium]